MSPNNFISWFFCWIPASKIYFRKERDPLCGSKPPILACDGTHIGASIRNMKLERPVTDLNLPDTTYKAQHKRGSHQRSKCKQPFELFVQKDAQEDQREGYY